MTDVDPADGREEERPDSDPIEDAIDIEGRTLAEGGQEAVFEPAIQHGSYPATYSAEVWYMSPDDPRIMLDLEGAWGRIVYLLELPKAEELAGSILEATEECERIAEEEGVSL